LYVTLLGTDDEESKRRGSEAIRETIVAPAANDIRVSSLWGGCLDKEEEEVVDDVDLVLTLLYCCWCCTWTTGEGKTLSKLGRIEFHEASLPTCGDQPVKSGWVVTPPGSVNTYAKELNADREGATLSALRRTEMRAFTSSGCVDIAVVDDDDVDALAAAEVKREW